MDSITVSRHKHTRFWAVRTADGELICVCVYRRGALEVARRLEAGFTYRLPDGPAFQETPPASIGVAKLSANGKPRV